MSGRPTSSMPPYGYVKSPENKDLWIIDEEAAAVVRRVFGLVMEGKGLYQICCILTDEKIGNPGYYFQQKGTGRRKNTPIKDPYVWHINTVERMLQKREYCGDIVNFKTSKHFKDKHAKYNDKSEWVIFEDMHEPIIDRVTFENVQRTYKSQKRKRADKSGSLHPLAGLLFCADCGGKMYIYRANWGEDKFFGRCENYRRGFDKIQHSRYKGRNCNSGHHVCANNLLELVRHTIKAVADYAKVDKAGFERTLKELLAREQTSEVKAKQKRLAAARKRHIELETLHTKIYEDYALGKLPEKRYEALSQTYGQEQEALEKEIVGIQSDVEKYEDSSTRSRRFTELANRYTDFTDLTPAMIREFIEKIVVHEREMGFVWKTPQQIDIHFNFVGEFIAPDSEYLPSDEEMAEIERIESQRERNRRNYMKWKGSDGQKAHLVRKKEKELAEKATKSNQTEGRNENDEL